MRLYITGPVGSGKSTLARRVSARTGAPCFHLDEVAHTADRTQKWGNQKRPQGERDALFAAALARESWVMEDAGRVCFAEGMARADRVVLLDPPPRVRRARIVRRWVRQNLGLERAGYRPIAAVLRAMLRWSRNYDTGADDLRARVGTFGDKLTVLRTRGEVEDFLLSLPEGK